VTRIVDLAAENELAVREAAQLLMEPEPFDWPTIDAALDEVRACVAPGHVARMAVESNVVLGWTGAQERNGRIWELHPLVVRADQQRKGIGRALVADLEDYVRARGGHTLFVGADNDIRVEESTAWIDLNPGLPAILADLDRARARQYEFYERCGYVIVGVVPDGKGRGNIYMAKRIASVGRG
jgi:aminoglycoside 6'-N-acetyltransferase I